MHHHVNHCFCTRAEHSNDFYDAGNIVEISKLEADADDWDSLIDIKRVVSEEELEISKSVMKRMAEKHPDIYKEMSVEGMAERDCPFLKDEVRLWLNDNIKDKDGEPGWVIGTDQYRVIENTRLSLFFQRRNDAKKFIRTWSKFKKSTSFFNYLADPIINKVLDTDTGKYHDRHND